MNKRLKLQMVSDIACPWCAVGVSAMASALERLGNEVQVDLHFEPFELNPNLGAEGVQTVPYLQGKYGISEAQIRANQARIAQAGANAGFSFGQRPMVWNTFAAHRLLHWAGQQNAAAQFRLKRALLAAYHGRGENPGAPEVLLACAKEAGLADREAQAVIASEQFTTEVNAAQAQWRKAGIQSVPSLIVNDRHLIQGAQPSEQYEAALRQLAQTLH